jgi:dipeptidyl-peptidase-4
MIRKLALLLLLATPLLAQKKVLTLEAIYDPTKKVFFGGAVQSGFEWVDDRAFVWPRNDGKGKFLEWRLFDVVTGKERPLFHHTKLDAALVAAGVPQATATEAARSDEMTFNGGKTAAVLTIDEDLYLYTFATNKVTRLTTAAGEEEEAEFSPDGKSVAFVRANDLYVVDLAAKERRLTTDGTSQILNGKLDYVYQEEVYGRGIWKAYWWSPDSARIAFLQLDERRVPEYTIVDPIPYRPELNVYDYPKAGDPNPSVKLFVVPAGGGTRVEVETAKEGEILIVNVAWNGADSLTYQVQNREQTWLDLATASPTNGKSRTLLHETTPAWVDPLAAPTALPDGSFLWQSERSGYRHVYQYRADGTLVRQVTSGTWEVREVHGADRQYVYFSATERSPIGLDIYRIRFDGTGLQRLSGPLGKHGAVFNPSRTHYIDRWSDIRTPDQIRVHRNDGTQARVVEENRVAALAEYTLPRPEFVHVPTRDGFPMEAMIIRPSDFDAAEKYPVYQFVYGGPGAQQVRNEWRGQFMLFNQLIAQQGAIVFICDNRSASGKGAVSRWPVYKNFGELELSDLEDAVNWLKKDPAIDRNRFVVNGWSYGGFMVLYAMTHTRLYVGGIAGGPVVDWRNYDSIYTERYMLEPRNNVEGYRKSSPRFAAAQLHGNLLLLHGTTDDNVHTQNTIQFAQELQQIGRPFEMMLFPRTKHAVTQANTLAFMQRTVLEFVKRQLRL